MLKKGFSGPPPPTRLKADDRGKSTKDVQRSQAASTGLPCGIKDLALFLDPLDLELLKCSLGEESCFDSTNFQNSFKQMVGSFDDKSDDWDFNIEIPKLLNDMVVSSKGDSSSSSWINTNVSDNWCMHYNEDFQGQINTTKEDSKDFHDVEMGEPPPVAISHHQNRHANVFYSRSEVLQLRPPNTLLSSIVKEGGQLFTLEKLVEDLHHAHGPKPMDLSCSEEELCQHQIKTPIISASSHPRKGRSKKVILRKNHILVSRTVFKSGSLVDDHNFSFYHSNSYSFVTV